MFLPMSVFEMKKLGWDTLDVILVSGDAYIDSPFSGIAAIGKYLLSKGFRVGVISQPRTDASEDITIFGEPELFWGVSAGCVDSMVANYTATGKPRKNCDFTPNGINNRRPDRASIVYTGLIRRYFKNTKPIVLGGIEASLRRVAHYDFKTDKIRRSILFDAKADALIYGMGEVVVYELAEALKRGDDWKNIRGLCYIGKEIPNDGVLLPTYEEAADDKKQFFQMFKIFYDNSDTISGKKLVQKTGDRYLIQNPPSAMTDEELSEIGLISYEREVHPLIKGEVRAIQTIKFSLASHRGCFGGCSFCAIAVHQGRRVISRSLGSIINEVKEIAGKKNFTGIITDIGGPTANMYGMKCRKMEKSGGCVDKECLFPSACPSMNVSHKPILDMLEKVSSVKGVRKVFATSGVRADIVMNDGAFGKNYIEVIAEKHVSGQLKLAPETGDDNTLKIMQKPSNKSFIDFLRLFKDASAEANKNQFVTCYFIAAHPGSSEEGARNTRKFIDKYLDFVPEQAQIFTPTPSTWATCMYWTGLDREGNPVFVEKNQTGKEKQKDIIIRKF